MLWLFHSYLLLIACKWVKFSVKLLGKGRGAMGGENLPSMPTQFEPISSTKYNTISNTNMLDAKIVTISGTVFKDSTSNADYGIYNL
jgi:hypothetical protein